jgi:hypothetical protein
MALSGTDMLINKASIFTPPIFRHQHELNSFYGE